MTRKTKNTISTILRYVVLCAVGVLMFYPMLWMVGASLKADNNEIYSTISFIPKNPSFAAYVKGWPLQPLCFCVLFLLEVLWHMLFRT